MRCWLCQIAKSIYPKGVVISYDEMAAIIVACSKFNGDWNYTIVPIQS